MSGLSTFGMSSLVPGLPVMASALQADYGSIQFVLTAYLLALGLPAALSPSFMMFTNYLQHVGCHPGAEHEHSRNFVNPWFNWLVFDNGYHTVHHDRPGLHWSRLRAAHRARAWAIEPPLNRDSPLAYCWFEYVLGRLGRDENRRKESQAPELRN